jgi:hypothetical protein
MCGSRKIISTTELRQNGFDAEISSFLPIWNEATRPRRICRAFIANCTRVKQRAYLPVSIQAEMLLRSLLIACIVGTLGRAQKPAANDGRVHAEMRNVFYHFSGSIAVHIAHLKGDLLPVGREGLPVFEDPNSFAVDVESAEISISTGALANVLNQHAFAMADAPLKAIQVATQGEKLKITGRLRSAGVPFESDGALAVTPDGEIRVHTEKIKAMCR